MVGWLWLGQGWELVICGPVKLTGIDDATTHNRAVTGQIFSGGMYDQCGAMLNWAGQIRRGSCVIHDQWNTSRV